jgi:hypothetical protein
VIGDDVPCKNPASASVDGGPEATRWWILHAGSTGRSRGATHSAGVASAASLLTASALRAFCALNHPPLGGDIAFSASAVPRIFFIRGKRPATGIGGAKLPAPITHSLIALQAFSHRIKCMVTSSPVFMPRLRVSGARDESIC